MDKKNYRVIKEPINSTLYSVQNMDYKWGVIDENEKVIVEFGKYNWIDGFQNGLAKVIGHKDTTSPNSQIINIETGDVLPDRVEQGVINEAGEEVIELSDGYIIWKFYGKDYPTIVKEKDGIKQKIPFYILNPDLVVGHEDYGLDSDYDDTPSYRELMMDTWDAMTDGQYGDMPEGFDGDFDFLGR